jgi:hypothetical protein
MLRTSADKLGLKSLFSRPVEHVNQETGQQEDIVVLWKGGFILCVGNQRTMEDGLCERAGERSQSAEMLWLRSLISAAQLSTVNSIKELGRWTAEICVKLQTADCISSAEDQWTIADRLCKRVQWGGTMLCEDAGGG